MTFQLDLPFSIRQIAAFVGALIVATVVVAVAEWFRRQPPRNP